MNNGNHHDVVKASEQVIGVDVKNTQQEDLGEITELMLEKVSGKVAYVVLAFGGILGMGEKYFAVPWNAISYDKNEECFILNKSTAELKNAPGFDKDHWPNMADRQWGESINKYYGSKPYWSDL